MDAHETTTVGWRAARHPRRPAFATLLVLLCIPFVYIAFTARFWDHPGDVIGNVAIVCLIGVFAVRRGRVIWGLFVFAWAVTVWDAWSKVPRDWHLSIYGSEVAALLLLLSPQVRRELRPRTPLRQLLRLRRRRRSYSAA